MNSNLHLNFINKDLSKQVHTEEQGFVIGIVTNDLRLNQFTAFNQMQQTGNLTQLTLEIQTIALFSNQVNITITSVECVHELLNIDIMHIKASWHMGLLKINISTPRARRCFVQELEIGNDSSRIISHLGENNPIIH